MPVIYNALHEFGKSSLRLALVWGGALIFGLAYLILAPPMYFGGPKFYDATIHSKITEVVSYSRGFPRVILSDGRNILLMTVSSAQKYVQAGDSVVKSANTNSMSVYRHYPTYIEVSSFGGGGNLEYEYSGLLKRYRIPNHLVDGTTPAQ